MLRLKTLALCCGLSAISLFNSAQATELTKRVKPITGPASIYSNCFGGRRTASGERFSLGSNIAASKTLPLGTTARVTNLETGRSAVVRILDRGPFVRGRILDLSPATARQLGMVRQGVVTVTVEPISYEQVTYLHERRFRD